jgi:hypothetical protein
MILSQNLLHINMIFIHIMKLCDSNLSRVDMTGRHIGSSLLCFIVIVVWSVIPQHCGEFDRSSVCTWDIQPGLFRWTNGNEWIYEAMWFWYHYCITPPDQIPSFMFSSYFAGQGVGSLPAAYTEWSKSHTTHKSVTRENFTIMLVVSLILYVGKTDFLPRATGAGATLTPSCTPSVEWERYLWQDGFFARSMCFYSWALLFHSVICRMSECV